MPSLRRQDFFDGSGFYFAFCPQVQFPLMLVCAVPWRLCPHLWYLNSCSVNAHQVLYTLSRSNENGDVFCPLLFLLSQNPCPTEEGWRMG